jgi:hypothetical protein
MLQTFVHGFVCKVLLAEVVKLFYTLMSTKYNVPSGSINVSDIFAWNNGDMNFVSIGALGKSLAILVWMLSMRLSNALEIESVGRKALDVHIVESYKDELIN